MKRIIINTLLSITKRWIQFLFRFTDDGRSYDVVEEVAKELCNIFCGGPWVSLPTASDDYGNYSKSGFRRCAKRIIEMILKVN